VARLLAVHRRERCAGRAGALPAGAVLVVDEAGMLGTRDLAWQQSRLDPFFPIFKPPRAAFGIHPSPAGTSV
jgi:hypothetical protein